MIAKVSKKRGGVRRAWGRLLLDTLIKRGAVNVNVNVNVKVSPLASASTARRNPLIFTFDKAVIPFHTIPFHITSFDMTNAKILEVYRG